MSRDRRKMGKRLTPAQAAKNLARATKTATIPHRFVGTVNDVTDRETTGTVLVDCHLSTNPITVHVRANVDLAADDRIFVKRDLAMGDVYTFDGFVDGGGTGNNGAGAVIPWTQSPGVTSPPGTDLEISAPAGQTTIIGSPGDPVQFDGDVDLVLNDLADVNAGSPSDNDSLTWDTGTSRWIPEAVVSGAWPDDGTCKIGTTVYSTFALAIAAASAGDLIKVGEGSFTCDDKTVPDGVDVIGSGIGVTILTSSTQAITLRVGDASYIAGLTVQNTYATSHSHGIYQGTDGDYSEFRLVRSECTNGGGAGNIARTWWLCNALLTECEGVGTASSGYALGLMSVDSTDGLVTIDGGYFYGNGAAGSSDIDTLYATADIEVNDPRLGGGGVNVLYGNGNIVGEGGIYGSWTPTVTQSGSVSVTVNYATYSIRGKRCHVEVSLTVTGSGTTANQIVIGGQPTLIQPTRTGALIPIGHVVLQDNSGPTNYTGVVTANAGNDWRLFDSNSNGARFGASFGLASSDVINLNCTYEVA